MMNQKTKNVEIGGRTFQMRRLTAEDGSYWLGMVISAASEAIQKAVAKASDEIKARAVEEGTSKENGELASDLARGYASAALESFDRSTYRAAQKDCLAVVSLQVEGGGCVPVRTDDGRWAFADIAEDFGLVRRLTLEALTFNLTDFFERNLSA